jgi:two-component system, NtrC family, response regulator AtoC
MAATDSAVLVSGESGTGKELVARTLHDLSPRREGTFLALNCATMAPMLMESELFGYEKGAFTNALERHLGCFEQADGGTLFLDEITEMAVEVQAKFLRVLDERQVRRIGATASIPVAVRVVAATNRLPASAVKEGKLSRDLFYRLNVFHLALPPLRERGDDIPLLARYYLESFGQKYQRPIMPWASDFVAALLAHSWPGNVRELRNAMERLALLALGPNLTAADVQQCSLNAVLEDNPDSDHQVALRF